MKYLSVALTGEHGAAKKQLFALEAALVSKGAETISADGFCAVPLPDGRSIALASTAC